MVCGQIFLAYSVSKSAHEIALDLGVRNRKVSQDPSLPFFSLVS